MSRAAGPFERIYDAHVVGVYRFIYARVGNHPDAEDLTAQVFVRAVESLDVDRDPGQIAAWLYRVAQNATADYWRAFYRLPEHYRRVLELRFLERLTVAETARAMGISSGNARVLQYRALRRAALLEDPGA
jgi:RNA polymerase sigma-70 factor, ECF subfamily